MRISGFRRHAWIVVAALALLCACAAPPRPQPSDANSRLFAKSFAEIGALYLRPVSAQNLAVAGLSGFHRLDPALGFTETPGGDTSIVLLDNGRELQSLPTPPPEDAAGWGALIGQAIARFRAVSPRVAALDEDAIDKALLDGVAGALDRFSRYAPPELARRQRAQRDGSGSTVAASDAGGIAVLRVSGFSHDTVRQLSEQLEARPSRGIVLDLRDNPGGLLDQAVAMADLFLASGPIVAAAGRHPASRQYYAATGHAIAADLPLVVLVNGGSASSSEIVAAALQDQGRAVIVGSASFGKGTVQTVLRLPNDGELTLTWAMLMSPSGYLLDGHGVVPTLCTTDLRQGADGLRLALDRIAAPAATTMRPRAALDEAGWQRLRAACPPRSGDAPLDLELAERLLAEPALYQQAMHRLPALPHLAAIDAQRTLQALGLTGPGAALSSQEPVP